MRALVTWRRLLASSTLLMAAAGVLIAPALRPGSAFGDTHHERFRIFFPADGAALFSAGAYVAKNEEAFVRISRALSRWSSQTHVRFLFVAPRPADCAPQHGCSAEHRMWQRVNAAMVRIKEAAARQDGRLRFDAVGFAFVDELDDRPALPLAPASADAIDLRTAPSKQATTDPDCPWSVLLFDPELPPVLGAAHGLPTVPVRAGTTLLARDILLGASPAAKAGAQPLAIWENDRGEFRRALPSIFGAGGTPIPTPEVRLHLLGTRPEDAEQQRFSAALSDEFKTILPLPTALQGQRLARSITKGIGDGVQTLPSAGMEPSQPELSHTKLCSFAFLPSPSR